VCDLRTYRLRFDGSPDHGAKILKVLYMLFNFCDSDILPNVKHNPRRTFKL